MSEEISRRDFIKASTTAGLVAAINPVSAGTAAKPKSRVVIATDPDAADASGNPDPEKIQDLVDNAIMTFTGKSDKAAAYEALFPAKLTTGTKIYMKRNTASGRGKVNTAVTAAFQKGLERMLEGTFPRANIENPVPPDLPKNVSFKKSADTADYIINCPVAWMNVAAGHGVTLSLKNTMNLDGDPFTLHHMENPPTWLYRISLSNAIRPKQVLSLLDAVVGKSDWGPEGEPNFKTGTVIVGSDLVAVDYNAIRLLEKQGAKASAIALGDKNLKAAEDAGLGTCNPDNMEVITIKAPWSAVGTINGADNIMQNMNIQALHQGNKIEFIIPEKGLKQVTIFDMRGTVVWHKQDFNESSISWNFKTMNSTPVPAGMYVYTISYNNTLMNGTVMVTR